MAMKIESTQKSTVNKISKEKERAPNCREREWRCDVRHATRPLDEFWLIEYVIKPRVNGTDLSS